MIDTDGSSRIYMIGSIHSCPTGERNLEACCYRPFLHLDLKTVADMIQHISSEDRIQLVSRCRECSFKIQNSKGSQTYA